MQRKQDIFRNNATLYFSQKQLIIRAANSTKNRGFHTSFEPGSLNLIKDITASNESSQVITSFNDGEAKRGKEAEVEDLITAN